VVTAPAAAVVVEQVITVVVLEVRAAAAAADQVLFLPSISLVLHWRQAIRRCSVQMDMH
jgi:hypothetical protein